MISFKLKDKHVGGILAASYLGYTSVFWLYPFIWLAVLSLTEWRFVGMPSFNGLQNFVLVLQDPLFWKSMLNVLRFLMYYLPVVFIASLLFAFGLQKLKYGRTFVGLSFLLANVSSGVAYSIVFSKIFSQNGPLNTFLYDWFGFTLPWLTSPDFAMLSISLVVTWKFVGYYGLILFSGLNSIPKEIYSAAELDNTPPIKRLLRITLPLINPQLIMVLVLAITVSFAIFTEPYLITGGGPLNSTTTPMVVMYEAAFMKMQPSWAATMSIFIALISFTLILTVRKLLERKVEIV
ncbi:MULTISPECIES: carbohydrate ABC transporter permease [unclassified Serratia (in: enterobacteria)]|uniref:carbohydrate ABC transporter permease n=1 Tax=unclassified Serratia (in: enterobacteria) TaxID=2647522 RepID=UPI000467F402|nr:MULTISPECIES: sugar ABC transporter permease [unclassified Serratia (in: enterobacteria)]